MTRAFLVAATASAVVIGIPLGATAQTCAKRCDAAYGNCSALEAAGCEIGGQLAGEAAEQLGDEIPIPGMGALFGSLTRNTTAQKCVELLNPCTQIRTTCLASCPAGDAAAAGAAAAPEARYSTLRIFSDHPRAIVYINEQRMGATPEDALEPFVSPEMRVGRYWVRLTTPDGEWEWRGEKTVEEGNINAVEGRLANRRFELLGRARAFDAAGETVRAAGAYRELLVAFPNDAELKPEAEARLTALSQAFQIADEEMFRRIDSEAEPQKRAVLCRVYLDEFKGGVHRAEAETALAQAENAPLRPRQPGDPAQPAVDDRAQVEAAVGKDLGREYSLWRYREMGRFPKFGDYMYEKFRKTRTNAIVFSIVAPTVFSGGLFAGGIVVLVKGDPEKNLALYGGLLIGLGSAVLLTAVIVGPLVASRAKKNMRKLEAAGMGTTALRSSRLELVGFGPLVDAGNNVSGLALRWEY